MKILVTGKGTSGSWKIRGDELGHAIGGQVIPNARTAKGYDVAVVVKRPISLQGAPLVYDVVDAWHQPVGNDWTEEQTRRWLSVQIAMVNPDGIVAATQKMAEDCERFGVPVLTLPHHARPGMKQNPIRDRVRKVGYEGAPHYLGKWLPVLEQECTARGWQFVLNPAELADVDILVALRDAQGYPAKNYKSNVKLANAQATGTPIICNREAGYLETQSGSEIFIDHPFELGLALDELRDAARRKEISFFMRAHTPTLADMGHQYKQWLRQNFS